MGAGGGRGDEGGGSGGSVWVVVVVGGGREAQVPALKVGVLSVLHPATPPPLSRSLTHTHTRPRPRPRPPPPPPPEHHHTALRYWHTTRKRTHACRSASLPRATTACHVHQKESLPCCLPLQRQQIATMLLAIPTTMNQPPHTGHKVVHTHHASPRRLLESDAWPAMTTQLGMNRLARAWLCDLVHR